MPNVNWEARRRRIKEWKEAQVMLARYEGRYIEEGSDLDKQLRAQGWKLHSINYDGPRRMAFLIHPDVVARDADLNAAIDRINARNLGGES